MIATTPSANMSGAKYCEASGSSGTEKRRKP